MATSAAIVCATAKLSRFNILPTFNIYEIVPYRKDPDGGPSWVPDRKDRVDFPAGTKRDDVIDRMIAIVQDAARKSRLASLKGDGMSVAASFRHQARR